jgi:hypothetical protein
MLLTGEGVFEALPYGESKKFMPGRVRCARARFSAMLRG